MRTTLVGTLALATGCARIGFDVLGAADAGQEVFDGRVADAGRAPIDGCPALNGRWSLEPPVPLVALNSPAGDVEMAVAPDGLTAYFASNRVEPYQAFIATRSSTSAEFGNAQTHPVSAQPGEETRFALFSDGLTGMLSAARNGAQADLWYVSRADRSQPFGNLVAAGPLNSPLAEYDPFASGDDLRVYFVIADYARDQARIVVAERRSAADRFSPPMPVPGLEPGGWQDNPSLTPDERVIIFSRKNPGRYDLFYATRPDRDAPFETPHLMPVVNGPGDETEGFLWRCELYFSSNAAGLGDLDIFRTRIIPAP